MMETLKAPLVIKKEVFKWLKTNNEAEELSDELTFCFKIENRVND